MVELDRSIIIQIINFVFLIWVLNVILYKPIRKVLMQRREKVAGLEKSIQVSERDATEKDQYLAAGVKAAREKGLQEKESLLNSASEEEKRIIHSIHKKAERDLEAVRRQLEKDVEQARIGLQKDIDGFAEAIGFKILGRSIS
ncbi:MAG: ATPase [Desulfobacteraceae bacterium]|nr:MAG: ATPase [Desulfobacteraceae bacterium]